ncbi:MAG: peptidase S41, partial [Prolixibacteraceae bacterium]|nr:peptidase S41 [Prolixibacteraceae bacterium]
FAYSYADKHREVLSKFTKAEELEKFLDGKKVLAEFVKDASEKGILKDENGLKESGLIINTQLKAYIARNIIGEEGFYPIIKTIDKTLLRAIEISGQNLLVENISKNDTTSFLPQLK